MTDNANKGKKGREDLDSSKSVIKDVSELRKRLNEITKLKEEWLGKLRDVNKKIGGLITSIKKKGKIGKKELEEMKKKRDEYNSNVKDIAKKLRTVQDKKKDIIAKYKIKDISKIGSEIKKLEESIEINAFSLKKEKEIMDRIKRLKKIQSEIGSGDVKDLINRLEKEKKKANEAHEKYMSLIKEKRSGVKEFVKSSKEIDALRVDEKEAKENYEKYKKMVKEISSNLSDKLMKVKKVKKKKVDKKDKALEKIAKKRVEEVEEKIKNKKKLTEDDLLALRAGDSE